MKKGFTLIELLAVIAILGIVALIAIPTVDKAINNGKNSLLETQKKQIIKGAQDYLAENTNQLPNSGAKVILTVGELQNAGYLELNIKNPKEDDYISPNAEVVITGIGNGYKYEVDESTLSSESEDTNKPTIIVLGGNIQYVELGSSFVDTGVTATSKYGADLTSSVSKKIMDKSGNVIGNDDSVINTNAINTYTISYTVKDPNTNLSSSVSKNVMIVDTTKPVITFTKGDYLEIVATEVASLNLLNLVTATDNSGKVPTISYTSNVSQMSGTYFVNYSARDASGNTATSKLTVKVVQGIYFDVENANYYEDSKKVTISFPTYSGKEYINQYSLDYGITWKTVNGSSVQFTLSETTPIIARVYDGEDVVLYGSYTVTKFNSD
jgi:type IV pilus assembly protein PilA